ncbi:GGDEF domain-containing protein [Actinophytocola oryzae]|uniref:Diguanylate cyclase (GGDEF)-like protein n=1 Tax=Actinophytocola oryzae TaxID=502181 RepID=A0A4R7W5F9_9PSEU|nr:GGDEF domain-containing protein [Actinophytocola oryzae]TDV57812.1 diguanylate cyclase (GGDEF)-like protein [Actinophytocola oryzae]
MDHPPVWVRAGLLLPLAGAMAFAGAARIVPTTSADWALAGAILVAAIVQSEITRRLHAGRREQEPHSVAAMISAWSLAAAVAVQLTLAIALTLVLYTHHCLRRGHDRPGAFDTFAGHAGIAACAVVAAHFAASFGAWTTWTPRADTLGVLAVAAAGAAYLLVDHAPGFLRHRRAFAARAAELGLEAALLATGAVVGALAPGGVVVVLAAVPVVVMLHNAALTEQLEDEAATDTKTGLATAASWQAGAERAFAAAARDGRPVGVLMVDLDYFKRLNDTHGHYAGDEFLAAVGDCLRSQLRADDLAGRFGGEEFTVLLPDTDIVATMTAAERIRAAISKLHVTTTDNHGRLVVITGVTVSIGAATHPHHGATARDCLRVADSNLYQAKRQGRNTVVGVGTENVAPFRQPR